MYKKRRSKSRRKPRKKVKRSLSRNRSRSRSVPRKNSRKIRMGMDYEENLIRNFRSIGVEGNFEDTFGLDPNKYPAHFIQSVIHNIHGLIERRIASGNLRDLNQEAGFIKEDLARRFHGVIVYYKVEGGELRGQADTILFLYVREGLIAERFRQMLRGR